MKKTGKKSGTMTSPRSGATVPTGAHPKNTGGKKGRSGRKAIEFVEWCHSVTEDEKVREKNLALARGGDIKVFTLAASYAYGKPKEQVEVTGKDSGRIRVGLHIFERDDPTD